MPEIVINEHRAVVEPANVPRGLRPFHSSLPDFRPTRVLPLPELATELGVGHVLIKDESSRMGLPSFKIAGASWAVRVAIAERFALDTDSALTLAELRSAVAESSVFLTAATDGNHGRALARMAKLLMLPSRIFVPASLAEDRIAAIESEGAEVVRIDADYDDTVAEAAKRASSDPDALLIADTSWEGYEHLPRQVVLGYDTILAEAEEAIADLGLAGPDLVLAQMGVGSFASAVIAHWGVEEGKPRFVGVEPETAACVAESLRAGVLVPVPGPHPSIMAGLNCGNTSELAWPTLLSGLSACIKLSDDQAREGMRTLAAAGLGGGECSGGAVGALRFLLGQEDAALWRERLQLHDQSVVLLFATEGITEPSQYESIVGTTLAERFL